jgi:hypothetical protein
MRIAFAVLLLALLAGVVVGREKPTALLVEKARTQTPDFDISRLERPQAAPPSGDPFAARSFGAPAAAQAGAQAAAAPAKPEAPELPFRYMGKVIEDGKLEILLLRGDEHFSVAAGQKIDDQYRLDKVTTSSLTFTYLPMKKKQTLEIIPTP